jgi:lactoylglutathione lyase
MKRFHVHAHVDDLPASIDFYSRLFGSAPTRQEADYAKWMLDDPRINFAISTRGTRAGVDHLGIQTDSAEELAELEARARAADLALHDPGAAECCYARSDKHWLVDPQGIAWEHFHTLGDIPVFGSGSVRADAAAAAACCAPRAGRAQPVAVAMPARRAEGGKAAQPSTEAA